MAVIDNIYLEFRDSIDVLAKAGEVSLQVAIDSHVRKSLLLSAASYFENILSKEVEDFVKEVADGDEMVTSLVRIKAISRQYHTWFEWEGGNANKFFSLFGSSFKERMKKNAAENEQLDRAIKAFLEIGRERNTLVHSDYASHPMNKTFQEIYSLYQLANNFVQSIGNELRQHSKSLKKKGKMKNI